MTYAAVWGISAQVEQVPSQKHEAEGNMLLKATYTGLGLYDNFEEALMVAHPMVGERFGEAGGRTYTTLVLGETVLREVRFGIDGYSPLGVDEIPVMFISTVDTDVNCDIEKFFVVAASSITPASYR